MIEYRWPGRAGVMPWKADRLTVPASLFLMPAGRPLGPPRTPLRALGGELDQQAAPTRRARQRGRKERMRGLTA
jgi:hypothetical protein